MNYTQQRKHVESVAQRSSSCSQLHARAPPPITWGELFEQAQYLQNVQQQAATQQQESNNNNNISKQQFVQDPSQLAGLHRISQRSSHVQGVINSETGQIRAKNKKKLSKLKRIIVSERANKALKQAFEMWSEAKAQVEESNKELQNLISVLSESLEKQKVEENNGIIDPATQSQIHVLNVAISEALKRVQALEVKVKNAFDELEKQKQATITANTAGSSDSSADLYGSSTVTGISDVPRAKSSCVMVGGKCVPASSANMDQWLPTVMTRVEQQTGIQMQQPQVESLLRQAGILIGVEQDGILTQQMATNVQQQQAVQSQQLLPNGNFHIQQQQAVQSQKLLPSNSFHTVGKANAATLMPQQTPLNGACCPPPSSSCNQSNSLQQQQQQQQQQQSQEQQLQQQLSLLHYVSSQPGTSSSQLSSSAAAWEQDQQKATAFSVQQQQQSLQQQQHLLQQKYQQQLLSQQCCNLLEMLSLRSGGSNNGQTPQSCYGQEQLQQSQDLYCEVCDKTCNSLTNYLQHVQSKKHSQKLQLKASGAYPEEGVRGDGASSTGGARSEAVGSSHTTYVGVDAQCREYCKQVISTELNGVVIDFLQTLYKFQERLMVNDPMNAKARRRMVSGLREVGKVVRGKKAKCVILAPNIEHIESEGGLDDKLVELLAMCQQNGIEVIYALSRKRLGQVFGSRKKMSAIAILDFSGANDLYNKMKQLTDQGRLQWEQHNFTPRQSNGIVEQ